jgi:hypothetical protein
MQGGLLGSHPLAGIGAGRRDARLLPLAWGSRRDFVASLRGQGRRLRSPEWRPPLRAVNHVDDFNNRKFFQDTVNNNKRACSQRIRAFIDRLGDTLRGGSAIGKNVIEDLFQIFGRGGRPADLHLLREHLFQPLSDFIVGKRFATV